MVTDVDFFIKHFEYYNMMIIILKAILSAVRNENLSLIVKIFCSRRHREDSYQRR